ncbi:hypothetical protein [Marinobacter sp. ATCH36]|uniref:hypothetical protein n=1 Tax=Marinobacter sp. ATCH36 TaxID=2945106 RepID=UPI00202250B8|nr:hypothetical protein [Marinobacter sp. ATCH36]MCL7942614.1 hypothetical protein [Marinobacter sp. ATCH36]
MSRDTQKRQLLRKLARGITYTGPMLAIVVGASAFGTASAAEVTAESEYMMLAAGEAEAEAEGEAKGEAEGEAKGEAEGEGEGEGEGEAEGEAEG